MGGPFLSWLKATSRSAGATVIYFAYDRGWGSGIDLIKTRQRAGHGQRPKDLWSRLYPPPIGLNGTTMAIRIGGPSSTKEDENETYRNHDQARQACRHDARSARRLPQ